MNKRIWTLCELGDDLVLISNYGELKRLKESNKMKGGNTWIKKMLTKILKRPGG